MKLLLKLLLMVGIGLPNLPGSSTLPSQTLTDCVHASAEFGGTTECTLTFTQTKPGGGTTIVSCDPNSVLGCPSMVCETFIADDAVHPLGISWDTTDSEVIPVPTDQAEERDVLISVVSATVTFGPPPPGYVAPLPYASLPGGQFSETGRWFKCTTTTKECRPGLATCTFGETVNRDVVEYGPEGPVLEPESLLDQALAQLVIPDPPVTTAPPVNTQMFVKLPTWFWVDQAYWNEIRVSEVASATGRLVVRVIGEPQYTQIDPGDGSPIVNCAGAGTAFLQTMDPWTGTDCLHIYEHTPEAVNGTDSFEVAMSVAFTLRWEMDFDSQPAQDRGTMGNVSRGNTQAVGVTEIQAVVLEAGS